MEHEILKTIFTEELEFDVFLEVGNERPIKAHRAILMGASKFFRKLFTCDFKEKESKTVTLNEMNYGALNMLVSFIYTGELSFKENSTVVSAVVAADYLDMDCAIVRLSQHITASTTLENAVDLFCVADLLKEEARAHLKKFIYTNIRDLDVPLANLNATQLHDLLKDHDRLQLSAERAFKTIWKWVQNDSTVRSRFVYHLFSAIVLTKNIKLDFIMKYLLPISKCENSLHFVIALMARNQNYKNAFVERYLGPQK